MTDRIKFYQAGEINSVRGCCPHKHRTVDAARRCMEQDQRDCASLGGGAYSDRRGVYAVHASGNVTNES